MKILSSTLLLLALAISVQANDWTKTYTVSGKPHVRIDGKDGRIRLYVGQPGQVTVRLSSSRDRIPEDVHVSEHQTGDSIDVQVSAPAHHFALFSVRTYSVEIEVRVPTNSDLDLHTDDGSIEVNGVKGDVHLASGDGHITAENVDGGLRASSGDGHITVDGRFDTLELRTKDGHIDATIRDGSKISTEWTLHTGDGSVQLRLPADMKADLDAHTGDGHINTNIPIEVQGTVSRSALRGRMNGGGPLIHVRTGDGSIRIDRL